MMMAFVAELYSTVFASCLPSHLEVYIGFGGPDLGFHFASTSFYFNLKTFYGLWVSSKSEFLKFL